MALTNFKSGISGAIIMGAIAINSFAGNISEEGMNLIRKYEGFSPTLYSDRGHPAIGYGHRLGPWENYRTITKEKAEELLKIDIRAAHRKMHKYIRGKLTQCQHDALVSFFYNVKSAPKSSVTALMNSGQYDLAARAMLLYKKAEGEVLPGLEKRRKAEERMFIGRQNENTN